MTLLHYTLTLSCSFFLPDLSQLQLPGSHSVQEGGEFEDWKQHWLHEFASVLVHSKEGAPPPLGQEWKCFLASNHVAYLEGILSMFGNALSKTAQQPAQHDSELVCDDLGRGNRAEQRNTQGSPSSRSRAETWSFPHSEFCTSESAWAPGFQTSSTPDQQACCRGLCPPWRRHPLPEQQVRPGEHRNQGALLRQA